MPNYRNETLIVLFDIMIHTGVTFDRYTSKRGELSEKGVEEGGGLVGLIPPV